MTPRTHLNIDAIFRRARAAAIPMFLVMLAAGGSVTVNAAGATPSPASGSCQGTSLILCEDFEDLPSGQQAGSEHWGTDLHNGTLTVANAPGTGTGTETATTKALHVHTEDNGSAFLTVEDPALSGRAVFGRMRLRVESFPTAPDWAHFTLVEATGSGSSEIVRPVGGQYVPSVGKALWGVGADGGPTGDWTDWRESAPTADAAWTCVEWQLDPENDQVTTWFDAVDNPELTASTNKHGGNDVPFTLPKVNKMKIGWQLYQSGTTPKAFDIWIDDLALGNSRIGC